MAAIVQTVPFNDTIIGDQDLSGDYQNQLNVISPHTPVTFFVTAPIPELSVNSGGAITTNQYLARGNYTISGVVTDIFGDEGAWSFTLSVVSGVAPDTSLHPSAPTLPSGIETLVPFQIDPATGGVAFISDYGKIIAQHLVTIMLTGKNERVMLPSYGAGLEARVFGPMTAQTLALISSDIQTEIKKFEPGVKILTVNVEPDSFAGPSTLAVTVQFAVLPFTDVNTVTVTTGGTIIQVVSP